MEPLREITAMMVSLPRAEVNAPENRRPSCLSIVIVNAMLLSGGRGVMSVAGAHHDRFAFTLPGTEKIGDGGLRRRRRDGKHGKRNDPSELRHDRPSSRRGSIAALLEEDSIGRERSRQEYAHAADVPAIGSPHHFRYNP